MIYYHTGYFGLLYACRVKGSVFLKASLIACPPAIMGSVLCYLFNKDLLPFDRLIQGNAQIFFTSYFVGQSFLVIFRTQLAYNRFWEAAGLLANVRSCWFDSYSSLLSFSSPSIARRQDVTRFRNVLARLMSILHRAAMAQISDRGVNHEDIFPAVDLAGLDGDALKFAGNNEDIILQWVQQHIMDAVRNEVLDAPAPILARSFNSLALGMQSMRQAKKIADYPFPFPYGQMLAVVLSLTSLLTPAMVAFNLENEYVAFVATYSCLLILWWLTYISQELERPFGQDLNDLPTACLHADFNDALLTALRPEALQVPSFSLAPPAKDFESSSFSRSVDSSDADKVLPAFLGNSMLPFLGNSMLPLPKSVQAVSVSTDESAGRRESLDSGLDEPMSDGSMVSEDQASRTKKKRSKKKDGSKSKSLASASADLARPAASKTPEEEEKEARRRSRKLELQTLKELRNSSGASESYRALLLASEDAGKAPAQVGFHGLSLVRTE